MTILVTGSAGHLGEALMRSLQAASREAVGIDLKPSPFTRHTGDIADRAFVRAAMRGISAVIHTATLHKPHVATHPAQDFVDTNISGTLALLDEALAAGVRAFVFTSTTSVFGAALTPAADAAAAWITESVAPVPKNIYGTTKLAAEQLCELYHRRHGLPVVVLRTSRFFPEADDDAGKRAAYTLANAQANELLYRRADIEDVANAHLLAVERLPALGFGRYILCATTPFAPEDLALLHCDAPAVLRRLFPSFEALYGARGWRMFPRVDRVYVNALARHELGWQPRHHFAHVLNCLAADRDFRSPLAVAVGAKGYHATSFGEMPYPVD
ncbi:UDP-glucose 4-epimerase [Dyella sp. SG562]|uniref:NAD-dependent epimerase/dehydratase family protein n=1 Tax=Dyella sp. SG562 TaxID=2587017 RepID=UPI001422BCED|nr:NAD(P)-dependent oxidoreductase [Dyella sp. SG562]NII72369.1 UDP-glucose 4-epimerase [Dyella sp. SG562]